MSVLFRWAIALVLLLSQAAADPTLQYLPQGNYQFPFYSSVPLGTQNTQIKRLVFALHGIGGNALQDFTTVTGNFPNIMFETAFVTPYFYCSGDSTVASNALTFCAGWLDGTASDQNSTLYSFDMIDQLVLLAKKNFPSINYYIFAGHSAGGQTILRYASSTQIGIAEYLYANVKYIVAGAGTYLYLNSYRLNSNVDPTTICQSLDNCPLTQNDFVQNYVPPPPRQSCSVYDSGKYGLSSVNDPSQPPNYAQRATADWIFNSLVERNITYMVGDLDTVANYKLDVTCSAMAQGPASRKMRFLIFSRYMQIFFPVYQQYQNHKIVPGCPHSDPCIYSSKEFELEVYSGTTINPPDLPPASSITDSGSLPDSTPVAKVSGNGGSTSSAPSALPSSVLVGACTVAIAAVLSGLWAL
ncbi:uncharacterized protein BJ171DRAFT_488901 [Polychytrium aggregatum]|uniref:uncharacterized protein n=1 Tax=Polychytrium aggregatum TaxID=110093 RepID=UPI0022FE6273|nr:uncharacterized protein BJ171DRAFT_488901 [Polychytrium aggregatum]KAI9208437.1 hypothetical protein BJ171DRAFT_488901 [Polychytrium aggregatum]